MSVEVQAGTPLAEALQNAVQPKLVEVGWSTGALDDSALSEYIILMLVNGKTQAEVASELANDLLGLSEDDPNVKDFTRWLFEQVGVLNAQLNRGSAPQVPQDQSADAPMASSQQAEDVLPAQDATMSDGQDGAPDSTVPTGPKSMRNGPAGPGRARGGRIMGQLHKAMDRSGDAPLHRIRGAAAGGRINREPPRGPKNNVGNRMQNAMNGAGRGNSQATQNAMMNSSPQQQMQLLQLLEEQSRMMAQILGPGAVNKPAINPAFFGGAQTGSQQSGKSLFERVEGRSRPNGQFKGRPARAADAMDTDAPADSPQNGEKKESSEVLCRFQLTCTSPTCTYAHQSPAAPAGITIDTSDKCSFGAACQNKKCAASHPSPAQRRQHLGSSVDCKFYPNCTNPSCPFRHPSTPPCRNGADCPQQDSGCRFSHSAVACRYSPCLNPACPFKHAEGQKRGKFQDKVWTAEGFDREAAEQADKGHVSERRFVAGADGEEELILPGQQQQQQQHLMNGEALAANGSSSQDMDTSHVSRGASPASLAAGDIVT